MMMKKLLGKWTGVCYYQSMRPFVADSTMKLEITISDLDGKLGGSVTEVCEIGGFGSRIPHTVQENVFHLTGELNEAKNTLQFEGVGENQRRTMQKCALNLRITQDGEQLEGVFKDPNRKEDTQKVELHKGETPYVSEELRARGREMVKKFIQMEEEKQMKEKEKAKR